MLIIYVLRGAGRYHGGAESEAGKFGVRGGGDGQGFDFYQPAGAADGGGDYLCGDAAAEGADSLPNRIQIAGVADVGD